MATVGNAAMSSSSSASMVEVYFLVLFLLEGLQRVSGIFFLETKESLDSSRLLAVIPFALSRATAYFVGLALEYWRKKLRPGTWIIIGSFVSAAGIGLCFLVTGIAWWSVFWGILFGAGIGIASPVLIKELTDHNSEILPASLKSTGSSFGCIILPFIINTFVAHYGLNGCYLIFSGLILNCIPICLVVIYRIHFHWPKPKWRLRKKSNRYQMSGKQMLANSASPTNAIKVFSKESFIRSMEPDDLQKVPDSEGSNENQNKEDLPEIDILKPIIDAKLNMKMENTDENTNDCSERNLKKLFHAKQEEYYKEKLSELVTDIKNYEKNHMMFEDSFSHSDAMPESPLESPLPNEFPDNNIFDKCEKKDYNGSSVEGSEVEINTSSEKDDSNLQETESSPDVLQKENNVKNGVSKGLKLNIPLEIKVHVVECTVTTSDEYLETPPINQILPPKTNGYRRHSNSLISGCYDNIDFTTMFQNKNSKSSPLHKMEGHLNSKMFLISEDEEYDSSYRNSLDNSHDVEAALRKKSSKYPIPSAQIIYRLAKPSCLVIVYTAVIFEFTLALLLTIFADFAKDNDGSTIASSSFVLAAFGVGGIVGQLSFLFWGNRLLVDGSHAAIAVILMLNGLTVAGILWSTNVCWLSGFFAMFGFVESGILLTLPRLVSDYIEEKTEKILSLTCKSFTGIAMMCLPCAIGFSRDGIGEYDGLLQVTSCLSVLCAVLCYFLPRITKRPEKTSTQP